MAAVVGLGSTLLTACVLQPTPTPVHVPGNQVWIECENRIEETYAITVLAAAAETPAYGEVEPCTAHGMGLSVEEPFTIGIRDGDAAADEVGRIVATDRDWQQAGRRLLPVITEGGEVTLGTWTEQRASARGFCR